MNHSFHYFLLFVTFLYLYEFLSLICFELQKE
jgi:hypothetical protein